ncbi:MAG: GTP-binding protein, partial [Nitrospira sp.]|nr:GTP-binding protein [Nitrospira sp.]
MGDTTMAAAPTGTVSKPEENLNIVIVGHVDHGKSTLVGRLYADTGSLPEGKLEKVQAICRQQGKEFEYAFLFDAFLEEQEQGITIDTARTFFIWKGRQYIIIDAPGHKEFLKNMISGAARAEAALLLIDALEGVKEQSKKHGYLLSLLGVRQFAVVVNKMDLVDYRQDVFDNIEKEYREFLSQFGAVPERIIPVSAKMGDNIANRSQAMSWYQGPTVLDMLSLFRKETAWAEQPLRLPVQDVYKFDARRIIAGRITAGRLKVGDHLVFSPSNKRANIKSIEAFNVDPLPTGAEAGESVGVTLDEQIFVERGEIATHHDRLPLVS